MPERLATLHDAMAAVLAEHGSWMDRTDIAAELSDRGLWLRPSDGAPPGADQIRARRYPELFELSDNGAAVRLRHNASRLRTSSTKPTRSSRRTRFEDSDVWSLTENDVIDACRGLLKRNDYDIVASATTDQRGPDLIARSANGEREIRIEAKGATSSKGHTKRFGKPFSAGQLLHHVSRAFYTAVAASPHRLDPSIRSAMAFPDTPLHRARVEQLRAAIADLDLGLFWVDPNNGADLDATWSL